MDLVNQIAGYTEKYYDEIQDKLDNEKLVQKYRAESKKYDGNI